MVEPNGHGGKDLTLETLRKEKGLSQEALARQVNMSVMSLQRLEKTSRLPRFDNAVSLARALGVSLKVLALAFGIDVAGVPDDEPAE